MSNNFSFRISSQDKYSQARTGVVITPHGSFETPCFLPVATQASIKALSSDDIKTCGAEIFIANTYHLHLRPGEGVIEKLGGLHKFMNWEGPIMTDSGGFQVFSLGFGIEHGVGKISNIFPEENEDFFKKRKEWGKQAKLVRITDSGVWFRSHINGSRHFLTPQASIQIQKKLGGDLIMAFDECTSPLNDYNYTKEALSRTHRWAEICLQEKGTSSQALFGSVQGGYFKDLREESAKFIGSLPFDGIAIGGSLGRSKKDMFDVISWVLPLIPPNKPRHLLGIGEIEDIFDIVERGIDMFDCVMPTRLGRMGHVLTKLKRMDIMKQEFERDPRPIDKDCKCYTCKNYSRAYLNHLFRAKELLAYRLATIHNLYFVTNLVRETRGAIKKGRLGKLKSEWL